MDEEQNAVAIQPASAGSGNKKMMILIVGLLLLLIAVVVAVGFYVFTMLGNNDGNNIIDPGVAPPSIESITFVPLSHPINTNLLVGADGRTANVSINFSIGVNHDHEDSEELIALLERAEPVVRSIAINVLRDMTAFEINAREGSTVVGNIIMQRLQAEFATNLITGIYIFDIMTM